MADDLTGTLRANWAQQRALRAELRDVYREQRNNRAQRAASRAAPGARPAPSFTCRGLGSCPQSFAQHQAQQAARTPRGGRSWSPIGEATRGEA